MTKDQNLWRGLSKSARARLEIRDYNDQNLGKNSVSVSKYLKLEGSEKEKAFIPGVELLPRPVFSQSFRGYFGEFFRYNDDFFEKIGLKIQQWASARMFAGSAKGFHIHPPYIPEGNSVESWAKKLFIEEKDNYSLRNYDKEQWDIMFLVQGCVEFILVDEREGMERKKMRFSVLGDEHGGLDNVKLLIPPGVSHALRCDARQDAILVYGTSLTFDPNNEGRISSGIEKDQLPKEWNSYYNER